MTTLERGVKVFAGPRASGRTTALINWALEDPPNRRLIVRDRVRLDAMQRNPLAANLGIWTLDHVNTRGWKSYVVLGVDDYDELMHSEVQIANDFGHQVRAIVLESEDYINVPRPVPLIDLRTIEEGLREKAA